MKISMRLILTMGALMVMAAGPANAKAKRTPASVDDCTAAAGKSLEGYLKDKMTGMKGPTHHELYNKFAGKNGYKELTYTYMYKLTDAKGADRGIARVTENHKCENTTIGAYKNEEDMNSDDADAAQDGAEEAQP